MPPEFANPYVDDTEDKLDYVIELTETNGRKLNALVSKVSVFIICHPLLIFWVLNSVFILSRYILVIGILCNFICT